jgi:hypothetical protein
MYWFRIRSEAEVRFLEGEHSTVRESVGEPF